MRKGTHMSEESRKKISLARIGNTNNKGKHHSDEAKKKMSESHKGKPKSEEWKKKIGESNKGKIVSEETRNKLRLANLGKHHSEETKRKMSEKHKGRKFTDEWKKKIGDAQRGKIHLSPDARKRISEKLKGNSHNKGKPMSEENKLKLSKVNFKHGKKISWMIHTSNRRMLGHNYLNNHSDVASVAHHIYKDNIVFIPLLFHRLCYHNHNKLETMYNINLMTIYWLIYTHQINFHDNYTEQTSWEQISLSQVSIQSNK